jgi:DEAD/DEAH box helicase domain-containing protein
VSSHAALPPGARHSTYKILDDLLIRPRDRQLWEGNRPTTLRYVVVDERYTFDGAQGPDLTLLRRVQARLRLPAGHLICVGTSATRGDTFDTVPLREYARQVSGMLFDASSVLTESRLSTAEFLGDAALEPGLQPSADLDTVLNPT